MMNQMTMNILEVRYGANAEGKSARATCSSAQDSRKQTRNGLLSFKLARAVESERSLLKGNGYSQTLRRTLIQLCVILAVVPLAAGMCKCNAGHPLDDHLPKLTEHVKNYMKMKKQFKTELRRITGMKKTFGSYWDFGFKTTFETTLQQLEKLNTQGLSLNHENYEIRKGVLDRLFDKQRIDIPKRIIKWQKENHHLCKKEKDNLKIQIAVFKKKEKARTKVINKHRDTMKELIKNFQTVRQTTESLKEVSELSGIEALTTIIDTTAKLQYAACEKVEAACKKMDAKNRTDTNIDIAHVTSEHEKEMIKLVTAVPALVNVRTEALELFERYVRNDNTMKGRTQNHKEHKGELTFVA